MKTAIVNIKNVGDGCLSAKRFLGECHKCELLEACREEESKDGRKDKIRYKIDSLKEKISILEDKFKEI